jgi:hypothetical protein
MSDSSDKMVLRTVYLPRELDERLRLMAFRQGKTKNDIIRNAVKGAVELGSVAGPKSRTRANSMATLKAATNVKPTEAAKAKTPATGKTKKPTATKVA